MKTLPVLDGGSWTQSNDPSWLKWLKEHKQPTPQPVAQPTPLWQQPVEQTIKSADWWTQKQAEPTLITPFPRTFPVSGKFTAPSPHLTGAEFEQLYPGVESVEAVPVETAAKVFGQSMQKLPTQVAVSVLQATQGQGGASVVNKDWADQYIGIAKTDMNKFVSDIAKQYPDSRYLLDLAQVSQNLAYSLTSMGAGLVTGVPIALIPLPGARVAAWAAGTAASGAVAYQMTTYQIMQEYLELKNAEKIAESGSGLTLDEENQLKEEFHNLAVKYGLWEAIPEAVSNLAFGQLMFGPLSKMIGGSMAAKVIKQLVGMYGEELLTETITQKGQSAIEVQAGLRENKISWVEAFREVAPQTFLLTTIMAGAGQVVITGQTAINKVTSSLKNEIGTSHPLYNDIVKGIELEGLTVIGNYPGELATAQAEWDTTAMAEGETVSGEPAMTIIGRSPSGEANLYQTADGFLIERIATGKQKGWWKILSGKTEYVGKTPERVWQIVQQRGGVSPQAQALIPPEGKITPEVGKAVKPTATAVEAAAIPQAAPKTRVKAKSELILWGKREGEPWVKLTDNTSYAERERRRADGWEVTVREKGVHPEAVSSLTPQEAVPTQEGGIVPPSGLETRRAEIKELLAEPAKNLPQGVTKVALRKELTEIGKTLTPDEKKLRQDIMATVKSKHISELQYRKIFRESGGSRYLTDMGYGQLNKVLEAVKRARPVKIRGQTIVTQKTEKAIQSLKGILIAEKKLTPEIYEAIKQYLKLPTDRFESADRFISERQARSLIRQMNFEAEVGLTEWDVKVGEGLAGNPVLKAGVDKLGTRIAQENAGKPPTGIPLSEVAKEVSPYPDDVGLSGFMSILRALRRFQEQLGGRPATRIYETAEKMIETRRLNDVALNQRINRMKAEVPQLVSITQNKQSMARIQQWLDADLKGTDIKKPDLSSDELAVAQLFRREYDQWKDTVRLERFKDAYYHHGDNPELIKHGTEGTSDVAIPDAPLADIKEAIRIYESQGETALREFLNTKDWGVIESGYSFTHVLHPQLRMLKRTATRATTASLHQRKGLEFLRDERTSWERLVSYERQMIGLNLQSYFRKMDMEFKKAVETGRMSEANARDAANKISLFMREVKGYPIESPVAAFLLRIGGWSFGTLAKVPWMSLRNLHQNIAFGADKGEIIRSALPGQGFFSDPLTREGRLAYTDAVVHQYKGVEQEQLLMGYMGKTPLEKIIRRTDYYHLSDKANRHIAMNAYGAKAERALKAYLKDGDVAKFLRDSGANELSATEQMRILEYLALDQYDYNGVLDAVSGGEAAIREIASRRTTLDHFNYVRYLRSTYEMGETGRLAGSLVAFPRSVGEKYVDIFSRIKRLDGADLRRAIHSLLALVIGSVIASAMLEKETGKERDAYNPILIFQWQVGGLAIGATQDLMELYRLITNLTFAGDEGQQQYYMDELTKLIPRLGTMFIPFYQPTMNMLQAATDSKYLDRKLLRQLREVFDKNYELNDEFYEIERDWMERIQHGLFGTATPEATDIERALKSLSGIEQRLGLKDEVGEVYTTSELGAEINSSIRGLTPSDVIEENGFSRLAVLYSESNALFDKYYDIPADQRQAFLVKSDPESIQIGAHLVLWGKLSAKGWVSGNPNTVAMVQQLMNQYGIPLEAVPSMIPRETAEKEETPTPTTSASADWWTQGEAAATPSQSSDWWENP